MLNTSAEQIVPRFIAWDNIMPKINEIEQLHRKFLVSLHDEIREFPFFTFSGAPKPRKKLGDDKKLADKKLVMHCNLKFL